VARGRGELVEPFPAAPFRWAVVTFPFKVRTADVFRWWDGEGGPRSNGDPGAVMDAARTPDASALGAALFNDLEAVVIRRHPQVEEAKRRLLAAGALGAVMCGSGPSVAALLPDGLEARPLGAMEALSS
jgi:4-diphosphocytidyl-2-C-methyl-D-erythritol kinase